MDSPIQSNNLSTSAITPNSQINPTQIQKPTVFKNKFFLFILLFITVLTGATGVYVLTQTKTSSPKTVSDSNSNQEVVPEPPIEGRNIILIDDLTLFPGYEPNGFTTIYSYNPDTKEKKVIESLKAQDYKILDKNVSPDGQKIYYHAILSPSFSHSPNYFTNKIITIDNNGTRKEHILGEENKWILPKIGVISGLNYFAKTNACYWSPDSTKLACLLVEMKEPPHLTTGRDKIVELNYATGEIRDIYINDTINESTTAPPATNFAGWYTNHSIFIFKGSLNISNNENKESDFYLINTVSKEISKLFSYKLLPVSKGVVISQKYKQLFFDTFDSIPDNIQVNFIKYNIPDKVVNVINSRTRFITKRPVISEDKRKLLFVSNSLEEIHAAYIYDLESSQLTTIELPFPITSVDNLLQDKLYIFTNIRDTILYNSKTSEKEELKGEYIGMGYF